MIKPGGRYPTPSRRGTRAILERLMVRAGIYWRREWDSNPRNPLRGLLEFQSSAFDRSAISPHEGARMIVHAAALAHPLTLGVGWAW